MVKSGRTSAARAPAITPFYPVERAYDDMFTAEGALRSHYRQLHGRMSALSAAELADRQRTLEQSFLLQGITFTVYGGGEATERIIFRASFRRLNGRWSKGA